MGDGQQAFESHRGASPPTWRPPNRRAHYYHHLSGIFSDVEAFHDPGKAENWARKDLQLRRTVATLDALAWALYQAGRNAEAAAEMDHALVHKTATLTCSTTPA